MRTELEDRTLAYSLEAIRLVSRFSRSPSSDVVSRQLVKAVTSVGANYREANRAESGDDFVHKTALSEKEASEACYWIELAMKAGFLPEDQFQDLFMESREILAIMSTINRKAKLQLRS